MTKQLENFLPYLKTCIGNRTECTQVNNQPNTMYIIKDPRLSEFVSSCYDLDILNPDYKNYLQEIEINSPEDVDAKFDTLSLEDLYAVLTLYIREDRFSEGYIVSLAEQGVLYNTVKRICNLSSK